MALTGPMTATELRSHVYTVIDRVLATGEPARVRRGNREVEIVAVSEKRRDLSRLPRRHAFDGTPEELAALTFPWQPEED